MRPILIMTCLLAIFGYNLALADDSIIGCNAFGNDYRAVYEFSYTKDSVNSIVGKDILFLELSKNSSFCFSYDTYLTDSLNSTTEGVLRSSRTNH